MQTAIDASRTPDVQVIAENAALDAIDTTSIYSAAQGVLNPPLAIGGTIGHTELSDGSAMQQAFRMTPSGVFLTAHVRTRRSGVWSAWVAHGPDIGDLVIKSHDTIPPNALEANGALLNRTTYADLFDRMGIVYGVGDGATTFATLDARGEFLRGWDNGRGVDPGRVFGSAQGFAVEHHNHLLPTSAGSTAMPGINDSAWSSGANFNPGFDSPAVTYDQGGVNGGQNPGTFADETRPRNVAQLICVQF